MAAQKYDSSKKKVGRPRKKKDIRKLVIAMALANLELQSIRGALCKSHQVRVPQSLHHLRRATSASLDQGIR
jgi:hypothetical protein